MKKTDNLPRFYFPLLLLLCIVHSWHPLGGGFDFFAHSAVGRWIWDHHAVPHYGLFVWTAPHYPWVAHSWLSQLFFFGLLQCGGPFLVMALNVLCVCAVFTLIWRFRVRQCPVSFVAPLLFCLAIWCSAPRFFPRQEVLTALLLVLVLQYLIAWREAGAAWRLADTEAARPGVLSLLHWSDLGIVALFALWINLHALVVLGLVLVFAAAICDALQYRFDRGSRALLLIALACLLATLVNPFGWHYWQAAEVLKSGSQAGYVDEWKPFWKRPQLSLSFVGGEACLVLVALVAWWANQQRRWAQLAWLGLLSVMFVMSRRNLWMTAIVALMVMAANSPSLDSDALWIAWRRFTRQPELQGIPQELRFAAHSGTVLVLVLCLALSARIYPADPHEYWPPRGISVRAPVDVAQLIIDKKLPGNIYNDYENSSYLQWSLNGVDKETGHVPSSGLHPLYLDLLNAYPDSVLTHDYFDILAANKRGVRLLQLQRINTIHLGEDHRKDGLAKYLNHNAAWKKLLDSKEGILWTRRNAIGDAAHSRGAGHG